MRFLLSLFLILAVALSWALALALPGGDEDTSVRASLSVGDLLGGEAPEGFRRATEPRPFRFPLDHGPHPDFRSEWWYLTGNLEAPGGEPFGFQVTFFRSALDPEPPEAGGWRTRQIYMAHLALTDGEGGEHHAFERFARGAGGLAGAQASPFRVWMEDWELVGPGEEEAGLFPLTLRAGEGRVGMEISMEAEKPLVLQGDGGLSRKGPEAGNASHYYSFTRLSARGALTLDGDTLPVDGLAWMDREWSTSALSPELVGWDWFALQLDSGFDLMFYQLRRQDGGRGDFSKGIWVDREGKGALLESGEVVLEVLDRWVSPLDGATYPSSWRLEIPHLGLDLQVTPIVRDQELDHTLRYWEGSVEVEGVQGEGRVEGRGYVELTGYEIGGTEGRTRDDFGRTGRD